MLLIADQREARAVRKLAQVFLHRKFFVLGLIRHAADRRPTGGAIALMRFVAAGFVRAVGVWPVAWPARLRYRIGTRRNAPVPPCLSLAVRLRAGTPAAARRAWPTA